MKCLDGLKSFRVTSYWATGKCQETETSLFLSSRFVIFFDVAATVEYMKTCATCLCYFFGSKHAWQSAPLHFRKKCTLVLYAEP